MIDYQPVFYSLKEFTFLRKVIEIKESLTSDKVVGFNVWAVSEIRKRYAIKRLKEFIDENDLAMEVHDLDNTQIKIVING